MCPYWMVLCAVLPSLGLNLQCRYLLLSYSSNHVGKQFVIVSKFFDLEIFMSISDLSLTFIDKV